MDAARLRATLGAPAMAWIVARARQRLARGGDLDVSVVLAEPSAEERDALDAFLGRRPSRGRSIGVRLADVDARLRASEICAGLEEAIVHLTGPLEDPRAVRALADAAWDAALAVAALAVAGVEDAAAWLDELRADGLVRRLAGGDVAVARALLDQATATVRRLPGGGVPIAELAAAVTGDSHALDPGAPLGTLVLRFAARRARVDAWEDADQRREAWAAVGVLQDELSGHVLVLNLRAGNAGGAVRAMAIHADEGEPYRLSVRQLLRSPPSFSKEATGPRVFVCENPTVVAAAANRLGVASAPLVCVEGNPRVAARLLLVMIAEAGVELAYHGDFDWAGVQIGNRIVGRLGARPWRFMRADYEAAVAVGVPLRGAPVDAAWDPELRDAMIRAGTAVHEERVLDALCQDLRAASRTASIGS